MTPKRFLAALAAVFAISVAQTSSASSCGGGDHDHSHGEGYTVMKKAAAGGQVDDENDRGEGGGY